jgi:hypothetical protein
MPSIMWSYSCAYLNQDIRANTRQQIQLHKQWHIPDLDTLDMYIYSTVKVVETEASQSY